VRALRFKPKYRKKKKEKSNKDAVAVGYPRVSVDPEFEPRASRLS
jgi:hypothetical protein